MPWVEECIGSPPPAAEVEPGEAETKLLLLRLTVGGAACTHDEVCAGAAVWGAGARAGAAVCGDESTA